MLRERVDGVCATLDLTQSKFGPSAGLRRRFLTLFVDPLPTPAFPSYARNQMGALEKTKNSLTKYIEEACRSKSSFVKVVGYEPSSSIVDPDTFNGSLARAAWVYGQMEAFEKPLGSERDIRVASDECEQDIKTIGQEHEDMISTHRMLTRTPISQEELNRKCLLDDSSPFSSLTQPDFRV